MMQGAAGMDRGRVAAGSHLCTLSTTDALSLGCVLMFKSGIQGAVGSLEIGQEISEVFV